MPKNNNSYLALFVLLFTLILAQPCFAEDNASQGNIEVARGLFKDGLYRLAAKEFDVLLSSKNADQCEVNLYLSKSYFSLGRYSPVPELMNVFFDNDCSCDMQEEAHYINGNTYLKLGDEKKAKRWLHN